MVRIVDTLGLPPEWLMLEAKHTDRFFRRLPLLPAAPHLPVVASPSVLASSLSGGGGLGPYDLASSVPRQQHQHLAQLAQQQQQRAQAAAAAAAAAASSSSGAGGGSGGSGGGVQWVLLSQVEFEARNQCKAPVGKRYFHHTKLADIIAAYPMRPGMQVRAWGGLGEAGRGARHAGGECREEWRMLTGRGEGGTQCSVSAGSGRAARRLTAREALVCSCTRPPQDEEIQQERLFREAFIDFLLGVLDLDPRTRWTPRQVRGLRRHVRTGRGRGTPEAGASSSLVRCSFVSWGRGVVVSCVAPERPHALDAAEGAPSMPLAAVGHYGSERMTERALACAGRSG